MKKEHSIEIIRTMMAEHNLAIVTPSHAYTEDELMCDPCFWVSSDIDGSQPDGFSAKEALEAWNESRGHKTLSERLGELGGEGFVDLLGYACQEADNG